MRPHPPANPAAAPDPALLLLRQVVATAQDAVIVTDATLDGAGPRIRYVNPAFTRLTGWTEAEMTGRSPTLLQGPGTDTAALAALRRALRSAEPGAARLLLYARNGAPFWLDLRITPLADAAGRPHGFAAIGRDVTLEQRRLDEREPPLARDPLTGLPDRAALLRRLGAGRTPRLAMACLQIDQLRRVSETFGPAAGDAVVMGVADLLAENVRHGDVVGRTGPAAFALCLPGLDLLGARRAAERLRRALAAAEFPTEAGPLRVTCSFGICAAAPGETLSELVRRAEAALQAARREGRNRVAIG
ncbi:GGDEF domain-containing protein [Falsiroseomonas selenitidurans]|uniref:Diguanylate cyclase n=1 Tax=Falsiroseomonas selenitidurans TaxID=2716335 RepID=A0ABX1E4Q9_9PROT|nr:diguanylate cyclase [Falsiroseomonas selenitidurans]NKC32161.1 diguanylate cyclase [Falsiroseomonas selenitidurans]